MTTRDKQRLGVAAGIAALLWWLWPGGASAAAEILVRIQTDAGEVVANISNDELDALAGRNVIAFEEAFAIAAARDGQPYAVAVFDAGIQKLADYHLSLGA